RFSEGAERREGPRPPSHVLAHAWPRERPERAVRRHRAARPRPLGRRGPHVGARARPERRPAAPVVAGQRAGRRPGRPEAAVEHPREPETVWVCPMDRTTVWPRTSPDGVPGAYVTRNAGKTWPRLDSGMPDGQAWWTVKRQAMTADAQDPVGLYFGTTSGELW